MDWGLTDSKLPCAVAHLLLRIHENFNPVLRQIHAAAFPATEQLLHVMGKRHGASLVSEIYKDENVAPVLIAATYFHAVGYRAEHRSDATLLNHPVRRGCHECVIENRSNVGDPPLSKSSGHHGGLIIKPSIAFAVFQQHFSAGIQRF